GHRPIEPQRRRTGYAAHDNQAPGGNDPAHNVRRRQVARATQPSPRPGANDGMGADSGTASLIEALSVLLVPQADQLFAELAATVERMQTATGPEETVPYAANDA